MKLKTGCACCLMPFKSRFVIVGQLLNLQSLNLIREDSGRHMVNVAQLVRAPDCGSGGRGFESRLSPKTAPKAG